MGSCLWVLVLVPAKSAGNPRVIAVHTRNLSAVAQIIDTRRFPGIRIVVGPTALRAFIFVAIVIDVVIGFAHSDVFSSGEFTFAPVLVHRAPHTVCRE